MKAIAVVFGLLATVLATVGFSGAPQQLFAAATTGVLALAFWQTA